MKQYEGIVVEVVYYDLTDVVTASTGGESDNIGSMPDGWISKGGLDR